jgi:hypothetical protein
MLFGTVSAGAHGPYKFNHWSKNWKKKDITLELSVLGTYQAEGKPFDEGAAEIVAHDPKTQRFFVINGSTNQVDVLDCQDPSNLQLLFSIDLAPYGTGGPTSVDVYKGVVAVSVVADVKTDPGKVVFFDTDGNYLKDVTAGSLPDMVTFTPDGRYLLVANEGEPNDEYTVDPPGSVSIIRLPKWSWPDSIQHLEQEHVRTVDFEKFNDKPMDHSIRIYGPNATVAQDIEPEYIAVSDDSKTAWVTLQENNALAIIDIDKARVRKLVGLGFKDHNVPFKWWGPQQWLDPSDRDGGALIAPWPVFGMYEPDGVAFFRAHGGQWVITANEGDTRDYDGYSEEERVKDLTLDPAKLSPALQADAALGRLTVTTANGDEGNDGDFEKLFVPGARSFSIWNADGKLIFDSGDLLEQITKDALPANFNSDNTENNFDSRSDNKGPEPEGVVVAELWKRVFAFIGLERTGGVMVFDITDPWDPEFVTYVNNRTFVGDAEDNDSGDLGPEGSHFIPWWQSPIHKPLLVVGNEISGTTTVYRIDEILE